MNHQHEVQALPIHQSARPHLVAINKPVSSRKQFSGFGGGFDRPWGAPSGMTRSSTLPNMSVHSGRGDQSHSRSLDPSTPRALYNSTRRKSFTWVKAASHVRASHLPVSASLFVSRNTEDNAADNGVPTPGPCRSRALNHLGF
jgi:hypothetical protein